MASLMRKASASFRGSVEGHKELHQVIGSGKATKSTLKAFTRAQAELVQNQCKWAGDEQNTAFADVYTRLLELQMAWTEAQQLFAEQLRDNRKMFESILMQEKATDLLARNFSKCQKAENSARKEISKRQGKQESTAPAETKLRQAQSLREMAEAEHASSKVEVAEFKTRVVKESVDQLAAAYLDLFDRGRVIFECQRELASLLPNSVAETDAYAQFGPEQSARAVTAAKDRIRSMEAENGIRTGRRLTRRHSSAATAAPPYHRAAVDPPPYQPHDEAFPESSSDEEGIYSHIEPRGLQSHSSPASTANLAYDEEEPDDIPHYAVPHKKGRP